MKLTEEQKQQRAMYKALMATLSRYADKGVDPQFVDRLSEQIENYMVEHGVIE